jgi:flagellar biogenesis protein FliO
MTVPKRPNMLVQAPLPWGQTMLYGLGLAVVLSQLGYLLPPAWGESMLFGRAVSNGTMTEAATTDVLPLRGKRSGAKAQTNPLAQLPPAAPINPPVPPRMTSLRPDPNPSPTTVLGTGTAVVGDWVSAGHTSVTGKLAHPVGGHQAKSTVPHQVVFSGAKPLGKPTVNAKPLLTTKAKSTAVATAQVRTKAPAVKTVSKPGDISLASAKGKGLPQAASQLRKPPNGLPQPVSPAPILNDVPTAAVLPTSVKSASAPVKSAVTHKPALPSVSTPAVAVVASSLRENQVVPAAQPVSEASAVSPLVLPTEDSTLPPVSLASVGIEDSATATADAAVTGAEGAPASDAIPLESITRRAKADVGLNASWPRTLGSLALVLLMALGALKWLLPRWLKPQNAAMASQRRLGQRLPAKSATQAPVGWGAFRNPAQKYQASAYEPAIDPRFAQSPNQPWLGYGPQTSGEGYQDEALISPYSHQHQVAPSSVPTPQGATLSQLLNQLPQPPTVVGQSMAELAHFGAGLDDDITVLSSTRLDTQRELHLVQVKDKELVVATTPQGVYLVTHFDSRPQPLNLPPPPDMAYSPSYLASQLPEAPPELVYQADTTEDTVWHESAPMALQGDEDLWPGVGYVGVPQSPTRPSTDFRPEHYAPMVMAAERANPKAFVKDFSGHFPRGQEPSTAQVVDFVRRWYEQADRQRQQAEVMAMARAKVKAQAIQAAQQAPSPKPLQLPRPPRGVRQEVMPLEDYDDVYLSDADVY